MKTQELELAGADAPNIETLKRADAPAIWQDFTAKLGPLEKESLAIVVTDASQLAIAKNADEKRKAVKALRCAVEKKRVELVAGMNRALGEINREAREIRERCESIEAHLQEQVAYAERAEAERIAKIQAERAETLRGVGGDPALFPKLWEMPAEGFAQLIEGLEIADRLKKERAKAAEEARLAKEKADAEERERQRIENERLKAEAAEKEAALAKERAERERERRDAEELRLAAERKADAERKAAEAKARAEREEIERAAETERQAAAAAAKAEAARIEKERAAERAKAEKERAALAARVKAEQEARARIEAEQRAKEAAEAAARQAEEEVRAAAAKAPDREKLLAISAKLQSITLPSLATREGKAALTEVIALLEKKAGAM